MVGCMPQDCPDSIIPPENPDPVLVDFQQPSSVWKLCSRWSMASRTYSRAISAVVLFITLVVEPCIAQTATSTTLVEIPGGMSWFTEILQHIY